MKKLCQFFLIIFSSITFLYAGNGFPKGTKKVLFLGNSITYSGEYVTDVESYFLLKHPAEKYEFINLGLPSETVSGLTEPGHAGGKFPRPDLHERLDRILAAVKPDVVFACYGMNDGIYMPLNETRFNAYKDGMNWLYNKLKPAGVKKIVFLTPPVFDDAKEGIKGTYSKVLDEYANWLLAQRKQQGWEVADVHFAMRNFLEQKRKTNASFKLANDGVHPGKLGHWLMAKTVLNYLGEKIADTTTSLLSATGNSAKSKEVFSLVDYRQKFMKDAWLKQTGFIRPDMPVGLALEDAKNYYQLVNARLQKTLSGKAAKRIRIACVGNSITMGVGVKNFATDSYPAQLQFLLGFDYEVLNYGVSGMTAMITELSYRSTDKYKQALQSNPDVVTIKLGTNDSRMPFRPMIADSFVAQYKSLIRSFQQLSSHPRIILLLPVASFLTDTSSQTEAAIAGMIIPRIRKVAYDEKLEMIDLHSITIDRPDVFPDKLHPNEKGMEIIAKRMKEAIVQKTDASFDIFKQIPSNYKPFNFYGYDGVDFEFKGRNAKIVKPRVAAAGKPWVWRARFWGHEPQTDIALLDRGFHIVYCDASELFGNDEAVKLWDDYYAFLQSAGLSKKAAMEGMSRGGVYVYNWAAKNPGKVACAYADAPVLDLRSWPGGKGKSKGSPEDWEIFKKDYGYTSEEETKNFHNNPIDKVAEIVKGNFPMLHVVGDADDVVPVDENTAIFEQKVKALGGNIQVIHKTGIGHHPHSLANPQLIVDFILNAIKK